MKLTSLFRPSIPLALIVVFAGLVACSKDKDDAIECTVGLSFSTAITDEATALGNASVTYSNDPTVENCEIYVDAIRDYLNELRKYEDCAREVGQLAEYRQSLETAEEDLDDIECQ